MELLISKSLLQGRMYPKATEWLCVIALLVSSIAWIWSWIQAHKFRTKYRLPNLVPGLPIVGNGFQMPSTGQGPYLQKLGEKYGEMFTLKFGSTYWVILNSRRVVHELLEKRASIYSSRQNFAMAHELMSGGKRTLLLPYGDLWRRERKVMHQILNINQQGIFEPYQDIESRALMYQYLSNPEDWAQAHSRFSNSIIMSVVFGRRTRLDDPGLAEVLACAEEFVQYLSPGRALVDMFPFLVKIPWFKSLQPWRWHGDRVYKRTLKVYKKEIDDLRERRQNGTQMPCFMTEFLDMGRDKEFTEEQLYFIAGALMEAGSDTTRVSLHEVLAAAALWPDWVERARIELDAKCGANAERLPQMADVKDSPVIKGAVKESIRWKPAIAETGIPHALIKDDEFEGWRFPAGTVVTWNHWSIANSPDEYNQPERFWPERFVDEDIDKPFKGHLGFGAGRRLCVGYTVATNNLLIAIARLVYCFDIEPVPGASINVSTPFPNGGAPFQVKIKPRSEAHRMLIETECKAAAEIA